MILYLTATAIVILFAGGVMSRREREAVPTTAVRGMVSRQTLTGSVLLAGIFAILFGILALRVNVGNDYGKYAEFMHLARVGAYVPTEPGFNLLARVAFRLFGDSSYLVCFAFMALVTVSCFLAAISCLAERFFPTFLMFMLLGYYFQSISTVRYYFALAVVTFSIVFLLRGDLPRFLLFVLLAALFHKSALVVLILYPLSTFRFRRGLFVALVSGGAAALLLRRHVLRLVLMLYPTYQETGYAAGGEGSLVSVVRCLLVLTLAFLVDRESFSGGERDGQADARRFFCHCNLLALALYVFFFYLPIISRIGYYLTVTQIFYVPALVLRLPSGWKRRAAVLVTASFCLAFFAYTMRHAADDGFRILPYQTFLFHDMPPITSETTGY
ncbi:MAG: EpsG family protein [Lachnospiraceae bacterium]|nr:EpsG family protein [Lachnospiraceae bacterium]